MQPVPPDIRPTAMASIRLRRSSAPLMHTKSSGDMAPLAGDGGGVVVKRREEGISLATSSSREPHPSQNQEPTRIISEISTGKNHKHDTRKSQLFTPQIAKREEEEHVEVIASLRENVAALTMFNQNVKAHNEQLQKQVQHLTAEVARLNDVYEEEKAKNEKMASTRKQRESGEYGYLPEIHSAAATTAAALQEQTQLEISNQRKLLSLQNRTKDLMENNKRLLAKIQLQEKAETDASAVITNLQQEKKELSVQVDSLSSTVTSQSSLIIGLRTTLQKMNHEEAQTRALAKKYDRCHKDLDDAKLREKLLREDLEKIKLVAYKDKEALMTKILDFQHRLQQCDQEASRFEALELRIRSLNTEKDELHNQNVALKESCDRNEEKLRQQEQLTTHLQQEKELLEGENRLLTASVQKDVACHQDISTRITQLESANQDMAALLSVKDNEIQELLRQTVTLEMTMDGYNRANQQLKNENDSLKKELQATRQLSQDETVQALQLARQKQASYEALTLLNEEKLALEGQLRDMCSHVTQLESKITQLEDEKKQLIENHASLVDAKLAKLEDENQHLIGIIQAKENLISQLQTEHKLLPEKLIESATAEAEEIMENAPVMDLTDQTRLRTELEQLKRDYDDLQNNFETIEGEYKKLVTKKYKTESFHSQVRLLQNENDELSSKMEQLFDELAKERQEVNLRTLEIIELKTRTMDPRVIVMLRKTQEALEETVSSLVEAETASESSFTCMLCMQLFTNPMTLTPCGHTYCASCLASFGDLEMPSTISCKMCPSTNAQETDSVFPNQALADLTARFLFRQQSLSSLTTMCLSLRNAFANRSDPATP